MAIPLFTAHNILLDTGVQTKPDSGGLIEDSGVFKSAAKLLDLTFPGDKSTLKLVDLGCLEGGYAVGFARMGFQTLGIEVRDSNFACCEFVKNNVALPHLEFAQDSVLNLPRYGQFDASFCCGLLYHLENPKAFLNQLANQTKKLLILQTHFSLAEGTGNHFKLSNLVFHEGIPGRWYQEFHRNPTDTERDQSRWSSFENNASFWIQREALIETLYSVGFDMVFEQFDGFGPNITNYLVSDYPNILRGMFVGVKS